MKYLALLIEGRHGLRPGLFPSARVDFLETHALIHGADGQLHHIPAVVGLAYQAICLEIVVCLDCPSRPAVRRHAAGPVGQDVGCAVSALGSHDDTRLG